MCAGDKGMKTCECVCAQETKEEKHVSVCAGDKGMKTCECVCAQGTKE